MSRARNWQDVRRENYPTNGFSQTYTDESIRDLNCYGKSREKKPCLGLSVGRDPSLIGGSEWRNYHLVRKRCNRSSRVATAVRWFFRRGAMKVEAQKEREEGKKTKERKRSRVERVAGITAGSRRVGAKRIIKELKVLKSRCILAREVVFLGVLVFRESDSGMRGGGQPRERRKTRKSSARREVKGTERRRGECRGTKGG